ncbi:CobW family GTP-binding protein [Agarivorans sp. Z349TD_8]|uniref:CobW family GTP-binding protein n=1 Tax=Agarivorans sp. Z349TD_8 TaxID=3421434 RepID=UPI003D7C9416
MQIITKAVPTNLISGFLGAGKTTLIKHLLANKPPEQRWAVLSNEFGEIGLDADFISAADPDSKVFIKEVPGGCLCCAAGVPFQVALTQLLRTAKPDRLLIEPTGLGHPKQIRQRLQSLSAQAHLQLAATLTLVDARVITDPRYTSHPNFAAQLAIADLILASKSESYQSKDLEELQAFLRQLGLSATPLLAIRRGELALNYLDVNGSKAKEPEPFSLGSNSLDGSLQEQALTAVNDQQAPLTKAICKVQHLEGYTSIGWHLPAQYRFEAQQLAAFINTLELLRAKVLCQCDQGSLLLNRLGQHTHIEYLPANTINKLELIGQDLPQLEQLNHQLLACCLNPSQDLLAQLKNRL